MVFEYQPIRGIGRRIQRGRHDSENFMQRGVV